MKRWAAFTVLLYALALLLLTVPVWLIAFGNWWKNESNIHDALQLYLNWGYWLWLAILVAGQALLLLLPIHIAERRLHARRALKTPVIVSAFFLANLCFAGIFSILCAIFKDNAFDGFDLFAIFATGTNQNGQPNGNNSGWGTLFTMILTVLIFWLIWALVFHRFARSDDPDALLKRLGRWLMRGSILELLIAVPSHVIVRRRGDCCAPAGTFWGIATGISVMLLCFGPGVFFLFVERFERLQPKPPDAGKSVN
ncbi:MAG: hypothetical protein ABSA45_04720 [Verrucomicrobiota bacterium]|jgi:hypothetical protein